MELPADVIAHNLVCCRDLVGLAAWRHHSNGASPRGAPKSRIAALKQRVGRSVDRLAGLDTAGPADEAELGYESKELRGYEPSRWLALRTALPRRDVTNRDVFVDLGSGKGRVVLQAARRYPFQRVIGVELSPTLSEIAAANLRLSNHRLRCPVELVTADAATWIPPTDLSVVYMFNPFRGEVFSRVLEQLLAAADRRGRPLRLIYVHPREHERVLATGRAVELAPPPPVKMRLFGIPRGLVRCYELRPES